ncbi:SCP-2 sterol transfer family protein [Candidatus Parabeggiatoa sp. HSG14]|uniref:SCP-2 sterol transfer family protein n=1 Tax=Candidatus Parabeggiatoa sp. HSG14 TaxID=3055593 RepID=UPI0025A7E8FE|nr:SCP-2 sterol transfer family protein [Thiotrichales bacterium HSG14]
MAELFSDDWMKIYMEEWNKEPEVAEALAKLNFNSNIAYGIEGEDKPRGVIIIENGKVMSAGTYNGEELNWDLRASQKNWEKWITGGIGMASLGMAYASRKLKFAVGDYTKMIKDPRMAGPFVKSFSVMGRVAV